MKLVFLISCFVSATRLAAADLKTDFPLFADEFTQDLYDATENDNDCTSSLGVSLAFDLIYPSVTGTTAQQMQDVFHYPTDRTGLAWEATASALREKYQGECLEAFDGECTLQQPRVAIANSIWFDDSFTLDSSYNASVGEYAKRIDFAGNDAGNLINAWVNETTYGLIDSIVGDGPLEGVKLAAINSLYLKASWVKQFKESMTNEDTFYTSAARTTATSSKSLFMHTVDRFDYSDTAMPGYQVLSLPFSESTLAMVFVLPISEKSASIASSADVLEALSKLESTEMAVGLPKFKFASEYKEELMSTLKTMGLTEVFTGGLCVFENDCSAFVDTVIQKTVIDVNEKGVEAAAVTGLLVGTGVQVPTVPTLFLADHPFSFFIVERADDLVLFEGQVSNPGIAEGAESQLSSVHSDSDFWSSIFDVTPLTVENVDEEKSSDNNGSTSSSSSGSSSVPLFKSAIVGTIALCALHWF